MNGEFCVRCCEKDAQMELLHAEIGRLKKENENLQMQVEALAMDVAFYNGSIKLGNTNE